MVGQVDDWVIGIPVEFHSNYKLMIYFDSIIVFIIVVSFQFSSGGARP